MWAVVAVPRGVGIVEFRHCEIQFAHDPRVVGIGQAVHLREVDVGDGGVHAVAALFQHRQSLAVVGFGVLEVRLRGVGGGHVVQKSGEPPVVGSEVFAVTAERLRVVAQRLVVLPERLKRGGSVDEDRSRADAPAEIQFGHQRESVPHRRQSPFAVAVHPVVSHQFAEQTQFALLVADLPRLFPPLAQMLAQFGGALGVEKAVALRDDLRHGDPGTVGLMRMILAASAPVGRAQRTGGFLVIFAVDGHDPNSVFCRQTFLAHTIPR